MPEQARVSIIDYGLGNVFSILRACEHAGIHATLTNDKSKILSSIGVILPGVGAYGDAMATLHRLDLVSVLRDIAQRGTPFMGVCLGMQLLLRESFEFGRHEGLGIIEGDVVRMDVKPQEKWAHKVPQVDWNRIWQPGQEEATGSALFPEESLLNGIRTGDYMYFVHSFHCRPKDSPIILATTHYGGLTLCSALQRGNVFATQFHPERSGPSGLVIYRNFKKQLKQDDAAETLPAHFP